MNPEPFYAPYRTGIFKMEPGLSPLGRDFGNGSSDQKVFQRDVNYPLYRQNKESARQENLEKYFCISNFSDSLQNRICGFIMHQLALEHPEEFTISSSSSNTLKFECLSSGESIIYDSDGRLNNVESVLKTKIPAVHLLDALALFLQEDLAIMQLTPEGDRAVALHLCSPNHWAARDKIGKSFFAIHQPVADIEKVNQHATKIMRACIENQNGFVRFAWGIATDNRLNHHPEPPLGITQDQWRGRAFTTDNPDLFVRIERQTLIGFPDHDAVIFTIRTYFHDIKDLTREDRLKIALALESMSDPVKKYKGLTPNPETLTAWLKSL